MTNKSKLTQDLKDCSIRKTRNKDNRN